MLVKSFKKEGIRVSKAYTPEQIINKLQQAEIDLHFIHGYLGVDL